MAQYVLIPGTWLGGWVWRSVRRRLEAAGHDVTTPTLTGLGDRSHLAGPDVNLETHVADAVNAITWEGLDEVILVGHSAAALVAAGTADRIPERIARLVYLGGSVPLDGYSALDGGGPAYRATVEAEVRASGDGWGWPMPPPESLAAQVRIEDMSDADRRWLWAHAAAHPFRTLADPLRLSGAAATIPVTWVHPTFDGPTPAIPGSWSLRTLPTGHWPMVTMPDELADILREVAESAAAARYPALAVS